MVVPRVQAEERHVANVALEVTLFLMGVLHMSAEYIALPADENIIRRKFKYAEVKTVMAPAKAYRQVLWIGSLVNM